MEQKQTKKSTRGLAWAWEGGGRTAHCTSRYHIVSFAFKYHTKWFLVGFYIVVLLEGGGGRRGNPMIYDTIPLAEKKSWLIERFQLGFRCPFGACSRPAPVTTTTTHLPINRVQHLSASQVRVATARRAPERRFIFFLQHAHQLSSICIRS